MSKVLIGTPMYGGQCYGSYMNSVLNAITPLSKAGISLHWVHLTNESLITRARNEIVRQFLAADADFLLFVDSDITFPPEAIPRLVQADKDVICAIYPRKEINWLAVSKAAVDGKEPVSDHAGVFVFNAVGPDGRAAIQEGLIEIKHGGTGFMLIKRSVFDQLAPLVPKYRVSTERDAEGNYKFPEVYEFFATSIAEDGFLLSEDYHFCDLWRKNGGKVYADPFIELKHTGTYTYTGNLIRSKGTK